MPLPEDRRYEAEQEEAQLAWEAKIADEATAPLRLALELIKEKAKLATDTDKGTMDDALNAIIEECENALS